MKALPLVLALILCACLYIISSPILFILWLLGGHDVWNNFLYALDDICTGNNV